MCTYIPAESGPQRQQRWPRRHRQHPDTWQNTGTWSKAWTSSLDLWTIMRIISKWEKKKTNMLAALNGSVKLQKIFTQCSRSAKWHTHITWDSRKLGLDIRQYIGHVHRNQSRCFMRSIHWKCQPTGYKQKCDPNKQDGEMVSLVLFLQLWVSEWGSSSHKVNCSQLPDRMCSSYTASSTVCTY